MSTVAAAPAAAVYPHKWLVAMTLFLGTLSVALSATAINVAIPAVMSSLGAPLSRIQWVLTGFMITRTVLIPSVGWLGDRIGDRRLFILSTTIFTIGSLFCSISWNADSLIFFRVIQGIGAGPLIGVAMAIMFEAFPAHERGLAMGLFMTGWSLGPFFGPLLGGYLTEHVHWRAIFYINIPIGLLSIASAYYVLPRAQGQGKGAPFDWLGCATMTGAVVALLLALSLGQERGWSSAFIVSLFAVGTVLFATFIAVELNASHPFVELRYFRGLNFSLSNLLIFLRVFGFRGANFLAILFLQKALNYSPLQAGIFLLPGAVMTGVVSPLAGSVADRVGSRVPIVFGFVMLIFILYALSTLSLWSSVSFILVLLTLKSFGQSCLNAPLNTVALSALPEGKSRMGSGIIGLTRGLGEAFGIATLSFLLERNAYLNLATMAPLQGAVLTEGERFQVLAQIRDLLVRAGQFGGALEERAQSLFAHTLIGEALTHAYQDLFRFIAAVYIVAIVLALCLRKDDRRA